MRRRKLRIESFTTIIPFGWIPSKVVITRPWRTFERALVYKVVAFIQLANVSSVIFPCSWTTNIDSHLHTSCGNELRFSLVSCEKHGQLTLCSPWHHRRYRGHMFDISPLYRDHWFWQSQNGGVILSALCLLPSPNMTFVLLFSRL